MKYIQYIHWIVNKLTMKKYITYILIYLLTYSSVIAGSGWLGEVRAPAASIPSWSDPYSNYLAVSWQMNTNISGKVVDYSPSGTNVGTLYGLTTANYVILGTNVNGRIKYGWYKPTTNLQYISTLGTSFANNCTSITIIVCCKLSELTDYGTLFSAYSSQYIVFAQHTTATAQMALHDIRNSIYSGNNTLPTNQWITIGVSQTQSPAVGLSTYFFTNGIAFAYQVTGGNGPVYQNSSFCLAGLDNPSFPARISRGTFAWARIYTNLFMPTNAVMDIYTNKMMPNGDIEAGY